MIPTLAIIACALYLAASVELGRRLRLGIDAAALSLHLPLSLATAGLALHAYLLQALLYASDGLHLGFFNAGSLIAWTVALLLLLASLRRPVVSLGVVIFPVAGVFTILVAFGSGGGSVVSGASAGLELHILSSLLSYSLLAIAAAQALLLAIQERQLRHHRPGGVMRALPPLQTMEALLFQMISVGFVLLSVSLLSGLTFIDDLFAQHLMHKTVLSLIAWLVFATLLWGRWRLGWRGQVAIRWTLAGFVTLMLAYFGSKFVLELVLKRVG